MHSIAPEVRLQALDVDSVTKVLEYAQQRLGLSKPVGNTRRGLALGRMTEEMAEQRWTFPHLVAAIDYMKARGVRARSIDFIYFHVDEAVRQGFMPACPDDDFDEKMAEAVYLEDDPEWLGRLVAARGGAKRMLYRQWASERLPTLKEAAHAV